MKPTLLLDCDGVLTDYVQQSLKVLNKIQSKRVFTHEDITDWEISSFVPRECRDEYWRACKSPGFVSSMEPDKEAQKAVRELSQAAEIVVVTSYLKKAPTWCHERDEWLFYNFGIEPSHVIHTRAKQHVFGHVLVDDAAKNASIWGKRHKESTALLWDKLYNRELQEHEDHSFERINSWEQVKLAVVCQAERLRR